MTCMSKRWGGAHRPGGPICIFRESRFAFTLRGGSRSHRRTSFLRYSNVSGRASHDRYQKLCKRISSDEDTAGGSWRFFVKITEIQMKSNENHHFVFKRNVHTTQLGTIIWTLQKKSRNVCDFFHPRKLFVQTSYSIMYYLTKFFIARNLDFL